MRPAALWVGHNPRELQFVFQVPVQAIATSPCPSGWAAYPNESFIVINPVSMQPGGYTLGLDGTFHMFSFSLVE